MSNNKPIKSMQFTNYVVNNLEYHKNSKLDLKTVESNNSFNVPNKFSSTIYFSDGNNKENAVINVKIELGNLEDANTPFLLKLDISAEFKFDFNDSEFSKDELSKDIKNMLSVNGNAILFPYIRSLIADTTLRSNVFPSYIFPTINFAGTLKKNNSIKFVNVNQENK